MAPAESSAGHVAASCSSRRLKVAQARAAEAERQAAEARRRAEEAERRASTATERLDRFQRKRTIEAQEAAARAANAAQVDSLETQTRQPLWQRIFRRRATRARRVP